MTNNYARAICTAACGLVIILTSGCSSYLPEFTQFGAVTPPDENRSLNGLGLHRDMWESAGVKCIRPSKLSPRLDSVDAIVLVGQTFAPPGRSARDWLEDWLAEESGRSVIYFGRDFNAEAYYREQTMPSIAPELVDEAIVEAARVEADELKQRIAAYPENTFCQWFYLNTTRQPSTLRTFRGPWAEGLSGLDGSWPVRTVLLPPDADDWKSKVPSWIGAGTGPKNVFRPRGGSDYFDRSRWDIDEFSTQEDWDKAFDEDLDSEVLLAGSDGTPLVYRLSSSKFSGSQIIIVNNGAPFLNATLIEPLHRNIATQIIENCLPADSLALFAYDAGGILISDTPEQDSRGAGLEMFLVWPLSVLTVPLAILAVVACVALLPILGRPQRLRPRSVSDFGLHVDAVGQLLYETRDWHFAASMISTYFRRVRREAPPAWVTRLLSKGENRALQSAPVASTSPPLMPKSSTLNEQAPPPVVVSPEQAASPGEELHSQQASGVSNPTASNPTASNPVPRDSGDIPPSA